MDAFQRGFIFWETPQAEYGPPTLTTEWHEWLCGFAQAQADYPDDPFIEPGESTSEALTRLLARHPALPEWLALWRQSFQPPGLNHTGALKTVSIGDKPDKRADIAQ